MKFLTVADCHGKLSETSLKEQIGLANAINRTEYDAVLFLGDNNTDDIECVKDWLKANSITAPMYGVFGNHDSPYILGMNGIENIHGKVVEIGSIRIGGFGGCVKYKEGDPQQLFTQEEAIDMLSKLPECDLLITHSNPQFREYEKVDVTPKPVSFFEKLKQKIIEPEHIYENRLKSFGNACHDGLVGIGDYIEKSAPKMCLHGHIHTQNEYIYRTTLIRSCYGIETVTFK